MAKKLNGTAITPQQRMVLAAVLGGTNLGMNKPTKKEVDRLADYEHLDNMIYQLWSGYMENEQIEAAFIKECHWWHNARSNLKNKKVTVEYVQRVWPDVAKLVFDK